MDTKHTPGPWTHIGTTNAAGTPIPGEVVSASAGATVCVVPHARPMAIERLTADAVLIAAAPELYDALRELLTDMVIAQGNMRKAAKRDPAWEGCAEIIQPRVDAARAAIAKAEGK